MTFLSTAVIDLSIQFKASQKIAGINFLIIILARLLLVVYNYAILRRGYETFRDWAQLAKTPFLLCNTVLSNYPLKDFIFWSYPGSFSKEILCYITQDGNSSCVKSSVASQIFYLRFLSCCHCDSLRYNRIIFQWAEVLNRIWWFVKHIAQHSLSLIVLSQKIFIYLSVRTT